MRHALAFTLVAALLGGCASHDNVDPSGIWINQNAIDAAAKGGSLRQALLANGPNLEWHLDTKTGQASYSNGFEQGEGKLIASKPGFWTVDFYGSHSEALETKGGQLLQSPSDSTPQQSFVKPKKAVPADAPPGTSFEEALYGAYLAGNWKIVEGPGQGGVVHFTPDGRLEGIDGLDRYALCLAGDCAAMSGEFDSMWMEKDQQGNAYIFRRDGDSLDILEAVNQAKPDEMPDLHPGARRWLLKK
ncbi:hypothetical protein [Pseudomonas sp. dw_358]|uniref:hypothetical protein n=1 Tax=Pseudomonas sp. dw_358 TaxID=2720083 RepID=UPI001BD2C48F|nr:hypothetical protein [Pseudomonas sp. dw_358]